MKDEHARELGPCTLLRRLLGVRRPDGIGADRHRCNVLAEMDQRVAVAWMEDARLQSRDDANRARVGGEKPRNCFV